jgi:hypothetical protein
VVGGTAVVSGGTVVGDGAAAAVVVGAAVVAGAAEVAGATFVVDGSTGAAPDEPRPSVATPANAPTAIAPTTPAVVNLARRAAVDRGRSARRGRGVVTHQSCQRIPKEKARSSCEFAQSRRNSSDFLA